MEGPYRDLGSGFARLTGVEGVRRGPSRIHFVEDALFEMLRNARDAGADNIHVSSSLHARRYRTLTVIDDGHGIPKPYKDLVFEPGVTTRHLDSGQAPPTYATPAPGSGVSLFHIKNVAANASIPSTARPTSIQATFDTRALPERASQSDTRTSSSNLLGTIRTFISSFISSPTPAISPDIYYGSPAAILATLIRKHIIQLKTPDSKDPGDVKLEGERLGLSVSLRTSQRIVRGDVEAADRIVVEDVGETSEGSSRLSPGTPDGFTGEARLELGKEEISRIATILGEAARTRYLEVGEIKLESRPGEIVVRSRVYEPEEEYE